MRRLAWFAAYWALGVLLLVVAVGAGRQANVDRAAPGIAGVLGGVAIMLGTCCCSPLAVDVMSRLGAYVGGAWRLAGRSLGRNRKRNAAVVTSIAVASALAVAGSALAVHAGGDPDPGRQYPTDAMVFTSTVLDERGMPVRGDQPLGDAFEAEVDAVVPSATWHVRREATWMPLPADRMTENDYEQFAYGPGGVVVADDAMVDLYELSAREQATLAERGALVLTYPGAPGTLPAGGTQVVLQTAEGPVTIPAGLRDRDRELALRSLQGLAAPVDRFRGIYGSDWLMVTEQTARHAGLDVVVAGGFFRSSAPLTPRQQEDVYGIVYGGYSALGGVYADVPPEADGPRFNAYYEPINPPASRAGIQAVIVAAALLFTLLVVAVGLALAAAEGKDERDVLVAVGARPATLRSMAGSKAVMVTLTGVVLGIVTALVPWILVSWAVSESFTMPWLAVGGMLVGVPIVAGAVAWAVSTVAQRVRPVRMSTLAFE